jgi:hypothetical protein
MKELYACLNKKGCYVYTATNEQQFDKYLEIKNENILITLEYKDSNFTKKTKLKLLVFQNQDLLNEFRIWFSDILINGEKASKMYHLFSQNHYVFNTSIALVTEKTQHNNFMGKNQNLIFEKLDRISRLLHKVKAEKIF